VGEEKIRKTGYVRRPEELKFRVFDDGLVEIVTTGHVSPEEVEPLARKLTALAAEPLLPNPLETFKYVVPGVLVTPGKVVDVEVRLPPELCPATIRRLSVPFHVAPHFLVCQLRIGKLVVWKASNLDPGFGLNEATAIDLVVDAEIAVTFSVLCLGTEPRKFSFQVEGSHVEEGGT